MRRMYKEQQEQTIAGQPTSPSGHWPKGQTWNRGRQRTRWRMAWTVSNNIGTMSNKTGTSGGQWGKRPMTDIQYMSGRDTHFQPEFSSLHTEI